MCSDLFLYNLLFLFAIRHIVCDCGGRSAQCDAQHCAAEDIGGEVHIEVQPGKGDKGCQHQRGRAQLSVLQPKRVGSRHPGSGVPGGEGMPMRTRHQHGDGGVDIAGAGRANSGLRKKCPAAMYSTSATAMAKPALRVHRKSRSSRVNAIQISP